VRRFVVDASVLLSAVIAKPDSHPSLLLDAVRAGDIEMVACERLLDEVRRGLDGRCFRERINEDERLAIPAMLRALALMVPDPESVPAGLRDPRDDCLVELARTTRAEAIITGDRDLLEHEGLVPAAMSAREACLSVGLI
jgi:putative PIN family toxin of toxin-antitoxin system